MSIHKADVYWSYASFYVEARLKESQEEDDKDTPLTNDKCEPLKHGIMVGIEEDYDDHYAKITAYVDEPIDSKGREPIAAHVFKNPNGIIDFFAPDQVLPNGTPDSEKADLTLRIPYKKVKITVFLTGELTYDIYLNKAGFWRR